MSLQRLTELTSKLPPMLSSVGSLAPNVEEYRVENGVCIRFRLYSEYPITVDRWLFSAGVGFPEHVHDGQVECVFVYEGQCNLEVEGNTTELLPGHTYHIPVGAKHRATFPVKSQAITICYPAEEYSAGVDKP